MAATARRAVRAKVDRVIRDAGAVGHIVDKVPGFDLPVDRVDPVLQFVVYGVPAPQGSKGIVGGRLKESSDYLEPWRSAVRAMSRKAQQEHARRTGVPWTAITDPVVVSFTATMPDQSKESLARGDVWTEKTPDLDKLQRAIGDSLAPVPVQNGVGKGMPDAVAKKVREDMRAQRRLVSVLHDDSRIVGWDRVFKVYPSTIPSSLGYPGATIRVWRVVDLERFAAKPVETHGGRLFMRAGDLRDWSRPLSGRSWDEESQVQWMELCAGVVAGSLDTRDGDPIRLRGRGITDAGVRMVMRALAVHGPRHLLEIVDEPYGR